jgi:hypothetical protein
MTRLSRQFGDVYQTLSDGSYWLMDCYPRTMPRTLVVRPLLAAGITLFIAFVVCAVGTAPRYNRIVFGALPLAGALICFGAVAYSWRSGAIRRGPARALAAALWVMAAGICAIWWQPSLAGSVKPEPHNQRAHALLTLDVDRLRHALFDELQPVALDNCEFERFGDPSSDGGYVMCGNLLSPIKSAYSYGIEGRDRWGCDVSQRFNVPVHEYDCFDTRRPVCSAGGSEFHAECVAPAPGVDEASRVFDSLENQIKRNGDAGNPVVIKMDVEGAEWATLAQTPDEILAHTEQLVIEFHGVGLEQQVAVVRRLKQFFHVAHLHFNNYSCMERLDPFPAWAYEVLFVSKRVAHATGAAAPGPHPLDAPNEPDAPDCQAPTTRWTHALPGLLRGFQR